MNTDDAPTPVSTDDRFEGLPTGNAPRTHRPAKKPTGLNWAQINADYEARDGVRKDGIWSKNANISTSGIGGVQTYPTARPQVELPPPPPEAVVVPDELDQADQPEELAGETCGEVAKAPRAPRYDYDIWTKDAEPAPEVQEVVIPDGLDDVRREDALAGERYEPDPVADPPVRRGGRPRAFTPEQTAEIVKRYNAGETTTVLAEAYGSTQSTIWRTLDREGVALRPQAPPPVTGSRKPAFTNEQEADVVHRYQVGESMESIANSYATFATTVRRALLRHNVTIRHRGAPRQTDSHHSALKQRDGDQPLPIVNDAPDIQSQVIADIEAPRQVGIQRYGTALQPHNGRDMLLDAYEEAMDLTIYLKGCLVERDTEATR